MKLTLSPEPVGWVLIARIANCEFVLSTQILEHKYIVSHNTQ